MERPGEFRRRLEVDEKRTRYHLLDTIRGLALISMIGYHLFWDVEYVFGVHFDWYHSVWGYLWQQMTCWTFIFLSGFCWSLGSQPLRRGLTILAGAAAVATVTWFMMPAQAAFFGILTLLAFSMLLMVPLEKLFRTWPAHFGFVVMLILFFLSRNVNSGYLGFEGWNVFEVPALLYQNNFTTFLGFTEKGFQSVDYFSLVPWFFLYASGYFVYRLLSERAGIPRFFQFQIKPLSFLGKRSFPVYLLHQPILYACLMIAQQTHFFAG